MKKILSFAFLFLWITLSLSAQKGFYDRYTFNRADTLRGMLRPERTAYDVTFYELNIKLQLDQRSVDGFVDIHYHAKDNFDRLQIDLYQNMSLDKIEFQGKELSFQREYNAVFIDFPEQQKGSQGKFRVYYHGSPRVARRPPWDGGFVWSSTASGAPWIAVACEGDGASLWWPNKDHLSDEPDSMSIKVTVPDELFCVANGDLRQTVELGANTRYEWFVSYPINNYNVTINVAPYAHFSETYTAKDGEQMPMDFYVLPENLAKAKTHFQQTEGVLEAFEHYFGKYPFWNDGFALVETPYLGMEHQGAIAYGNHYKRGYMGGMIPKDMNWDYIIVHETGHEYFGNSISCHDLAEMWIHESFTTYMEALYVEYHFSFKDAVRYLNSQKSFIMNQEPILGPKNVNWENWKGSDHYFKGSWVLHTLRSAIDNDKLWFDILKGFYQKHEISNVRTTDFIDYVNQATGNDYTYFFEQYLEYPSIPVLEWTSLVNRDGTSSLKYRWKTNIQDFRMPVKVNIQNREVVLYPTTEWQEEVIDLGKGELDFRTDLYLIKIKAK
ncbi:MAG: M1 family metallopeptidase [Saprospiraceae bacterium]|nr:M1 family metallopeptidase [Saprospiraceae bacterium]